MSMFLSLSPVSVKAERWGSKTKDKVKGNEIE
jgi:hypothetical protein